MSKSPNQKPAWATGTRRTGYTSAPPGTPKRPTGARATPAARLAAAPQFKATMAKMGPELDWWIWLPRHIDYWYNNQYGICVTTSEAFAKACTGIFIDPEVVKSWATKHGVLNGAYLDEVLDWMAKSGFAQDGNTYNDGPKLAVDFTSPELLKQAIRKGPVKIGVASGQLQNVIGGESGWFAVNFRNDKREDHAVELCGEGTAAQIAAALNVTIPEGIDPALYGYALFSWDTIGFIERRSMEAITSEAWLRNPTTVTIGTNPPTPDEVWTPEPTPPGPGPGPGPGPNPGPLATITLSDAVPAGTYNLTNVPEQLEAIRSKSGLTPEQWAALLQALIMLLQLLIPKTSASSDASRPDQRLLDWQSGGDPLGKVD